jgi:predicted transcriptional regulator
MKNAIFSIHKDYIEKILDKTKPFEFRSVLLKDLEPGSTIYLYETSKNGGCKKIVGEVKVSDIQKLSVNQFLYNKKVCYGCWDFIDWYARNILKDNQMAEKYTEAKKEEYLLPDYKLGYILHFALSEKDMEYIKDNHIPLSLLDYEVFSEIVSIEERNALLDNRTKSMDIIEKCNKWLDSMGFYNKDSGENTSWKYAIELKNPIRYKTPLDLEDFISYEEKIISKAPQSFLYAFKK